MKFNSLRIMALTALSATALLTAGDALSQQTAVVDATVTVVNSVNITAGTPLNYGTLLVITDDPDQSSILLGSDGSLGAPSNPGNAIITVVSGTPTAGTVNITGAENSTVNVSVDNLDHPTDGSDPFTLSAFRVLVPGEADQPITMGSGSVSFTADGTAQEVAFGATLTSPVSSTAIAETTYAGQFIVTASY